MSDKDDKLMAAIERLQSVQANPSDQLDQLRQQLEAAQGTHGYSADYWWEAYEGQRKARVEEMYERAALQQRRAQVEALLAAAKCPNCDGSGSIAVQTGSRQCVTRDMASDAGDLSMEGSPYSDEAWEQQQCQWCYERAALAPAEHTTPDGHLRCPNPAEGGAKP